MKLDDKLYKEITAQHLLSNIHSLSLQLSAKALLWLMESTTDNSGKAIPNITFYFDLLCRMRTNSGSDMRFRRPLILTPGKLQYSEEILADDWNLSRRRVRAVLTDMSRLGLILAEISTVASWIALTGLESWIEPSGKAVTNPAAELEYSRTPLPITEP